MTYWHYDNFEDLKIMFIKINFHYLCPLSLVDTGVQVGNIREKILPTSFKNILPKDQIKSEAQLVVR